MSTDADGIGSRTDGAPPYVLARRPGPLAAGLGVLLALVLLVGWWGLSSTSGVAYAVSIVAVGALGTVALLLAYEVFRARRPLLVADSVGLVTGPSPAVRLTWEETARVLVLARGWRGPAVGIIPADLAGVVARSWPSARNADQVVDLLRKRERSQGAPFVISLRLVGVDAQDAARRLATLAAGRTTVSG